MIFYMIIVLNYNKQMQNKRIYIEKYKK